jgi:non-ribosomal peptide synthetase component F
MPFRLAAAPADSLADWLRKCDQHSRETIARIARHGAPDPAWRESFGETTVVALDDAAAPAPDELSRSGLARLVATRGNEISLSLTFSTARWSSPAARRTLDHFGRILEQATVDPSRPLQSIPLLGREELEQLVTIWNDTAREYPRTARIHDLFVAQANRTPENVAVICGGQRLTYRELDEQSNQLAHVLRQRGVRADTLVGVCAERSARLIVALLGVLKAGGAYIPIDPAFPADRIAFVLEDAKAALLVTESALLGTLNVGATPALCLDRDWAEVVAAPTNAPACDATPASLAYTIYTSGSTGKPKGVQIEHRALVNFLVAMRAEPGLAACDVVLALTTVSFDIAELEIHLPLTVGATIVFASRETAVDGQALIAAIREHHITVMQATPATWRLLLAAGWPETRASRCCAAASRCRPTSRSS